TRACRSNSRTAAAIMPQPRRCGSSFLVTLPGIMVARVPATGRSHDCPGAEVVGVVEGLAHLFAGALPVDGADDDMPIPHMGGERVLRSLVVLGAAQEQHFPGGRDLRDPGAAMAQEIVTPELVEARVRARTAAFH